MSFKGYHRSIADYRYWNWLWGGCQPINKVNRYTHTHETKTKTKKEKKKTNQWLIALLCHNLQQCRDVTFSMIFDITMQCTVCHPFYTMHCSTFSICNNQWSLFPLRFCLGSKYRNFNRLLMALGATVSISTTICQIHFLPPISKTNKIHFRLNVVKLMPILLDPYMSHDLILVYIFGCFFNYRPNNQNAHFLTKSHLETECYYEYIGNYIVRCENCR